MAPPALGRYIGQQGMSQYGHPQQQQQQQHLQHHAHGLAPSALAPPSLGGHPSFGNPNSNLNLFAPSVSNGGSFGAGFLGGGGGGLGNGTGGGGTGLGSHAAQMGFAHGAALQRQEANDGVSQVSTDAKNPGKGKIREVWQSNLAQEMVVLRSLVDKYPYIAMGTEFPGIVARPLGGFTNKADYHYQTLRCNVDLLKMIQLGISLFSAEGEVPPAHSSDPSATNGSTYPNNLMQCPCSWQFNFRFSLQNDMYASDSINVLQNSGVNFDLHEKNGIDPLEFGSYLITSGLVLMDDVKWISFHSGYDFGYLLQILSCQPLPEDEVDYRALVNTFFPSLYDIKYLLKSINRTGTVNDSPLSARATEVVNNICSKANLVDIAKEMNIARVGQAHHAGSDALLTGRVFFELLRVVFNGHIDDSLYLNQIWGLNGVGSPASAAPATSFSAGQSQVGASGANGSNSFANGGGPSTPDANHVGLASTPSRGASNIGSLTPGGGGGAFGAFQFSK